MNLLFYTALLLIPATIAIKNHREKCPFRDTVDLTNQTSFENGSYLYHNILIPKEQVANYQYRLEFRNKSRPTKEHVRGCVCDRQQGLYCIKLCCEPDEFYNEYSFRCEQLPEGHNVAADLTVRSENGDHEQVNIFDHFVYQVGLPCRQPEVLSDDLDIWDLMKDGSVRIYNDNVMLDTVSYCLTPNRHKYTEEYEFVPMSCPIKNEEHFALILNTYGMALSVVFLIPTILVYLGLKELRENLRNKMLICYLISMTVGYSIIAFINISQARLGYVACSILGYSGYFFLMSVFIWLSVLCFDIWQNFRDTSYEYNCRENTIRFILYSLYAWGFSGLLTGIVVWAQLSDQVAEQYKPGIGVDMCWLDTRKWSSALYFYGPNSIILVFSIVTFVYLTLRIYQARCDSLIMAQKKNFFQENAVFLLRLFIIMGISWTMDILSYCVREYAQWEFIFNLTDFCNAIQGVLIFILFVLKRNVWILLKAKLGIMSNEDSSKKHHSTTTSITTTVP